MKHEHLMTQAERREWADIADAAMDAKKRRARVLNRLRQRAHVLLAGKLRQQPPALPTNALEVRHG